MGCKIIAEIGWNHMGDINLAKKMIDAAKDCGADYVKFQTWSVKHLKSGTWDLDGRKQIYEKAELTEEKHEQLKKYCDKKKIKFLSSIFNSEHISLLRELGCSEIKIASCEALNFELIQECLKNFNHIYISTGGLTHKELEEVLGFTQPYADKITLLHCVSLYPCSAEESNIERIRLLQVLHRGKVGYSDHTHGTAAAYMAIAKGATVVEKHFTIDNNLPGRDNLNACLPEELKKICYFRDIHEKCIDSVKLDRDEKEAGFEEFRGRWS